MFRLINIIGGRENQAEPARLPSTASETYQLGEALVFSNGCVTKCGATAKPLFIAGEDYAAPASGNRALTVYPVYPDMLFECPVGAAPTSLHMGDAVTLATDAMGVTATLTNGVATVWNLCGATSAGDKILVRF